MPKATRASPRAVRTGEVSDGKVRTRKTARVRDPPIAFGCDGSVVLNLEHVDRDRARSLRKRLSGVAGIFLGVLASPTESEFLSRRISDAIWDAVASLEPARVRRRRPARRRQRPASGA
jgi:hypothetical protein